MTHQTLIAQARTTQCHGDIFALHYDQPFIPDLIDLSNDGLDFWRGTLVILGLPTGHLPQVIRSPEEAIDFWQMYFRDNPSHGEYAGAVCRLLTDQGCYQAVERLLLICLAGYDYFTWDT